MGEDPRLGTRLSFISFSLRLSHPQRKLHCPVFLTRAARTRSGASQRGGGRPCGEISAARPRTPIPDLPPIGLPASQFSAVLGGRAIRRATSPRLAYRGSAHHRRDGAGDLTFNPGWLNFPALQAEGCALESRLPCGPPGRPGQKDLPSQLRAFGGPVQLPVEPLGVPVGERLGFPTRIRAGGHSSPYPPSGTARNHAWRPRYCRG